MDVELVIHQRILRELLATTIYTCNRGPRPSGAVMYADNHSKIPVYGHVTPTVGSPSCKEEGCMIIDGHCVRNVHAEVDALLRAAALGIHTDNSTIYSINKPCYNCTIACIKAGVKYIYYAHAVYDEERTQQVLAAAGVECVYIPLEESNG